MPGLFSSRLSTVGLKDLIGHGIFGRRQGVEQGHDRRRPSSVHGPRDHVAVCIQDLVTRAAASTSCITAHTAPKKRKPRQFRLGRRDPAWASGCCRMSSRLPSPTLVDRRQILQRSGDFREARTGGSDAVQTDRTSDRALALSAGMTTRTSATAACYKGNPKYNGNRLWKKLLPAAVSRSAPMTRNPVSGSIRFRPAGFQNGHSVSPVAA